jgi:hypothetical protein
MLRLPVFDGRALALDETAEVEEEDVRNRGAEGREIQTFEGQHNIYFCPVYTGAVCPVPAPRRVRCRAGLVTPRFRYLMIESWFSGTLSVARGRPSWFPREICVAGGAPLESGLASSLAGLYRVGASTRWCGWVKVKR